METTDVPVLRPEECFDSYKTDGDKRSHHIILDSAPPRRTKQTSADEDNRKNPKNVVYSAHEIPKKKRCGSSRKTKSKEAIRYKDDTVHKMSSLESTELTPNRILKKQWLQDVQSNDVETAEKSPYNESEHESFQPVVKRRSTSRSSSNTQFERDYSVIPGVAQKTSANQQVISHNMEPDEQNQQGFPPTVSAIITTSASVFVENPEEKRAKAEMTCTSRSLTSFGTTGRSITNTYLLWHMHV